MKASTRIDYAARIERVVDRIAQIDGDEGIPSAELLAGIAALSPFHFHRIFRVMTGETVGGMIRRVRLSRSIPALGDGARVTDASGAAGYATSQAYARAIRAVAGTSASEARASDDTLTAVAARLALASGVAAAPLAIEIVSAAPLRLHVLRNVGAYAELNTGYERLFERVFATPPMTALCGVHGLFDDDPQSVASDRFRFTCGVEIADAVVSSLPSVEVAAGGFLRARHVGDYETLLDAIDGVTATAVAAGLEFDDRPVRVHYIDTPDDAPPERLRSDIYLPLS